MGRWFTGGVTAALLFAGTALAAEMTGTVESIDTTAMRMVVDGQVFSVDPHNTVGVTLDELEVGDTVRVTYEGQAGPDQNAMTVDKVE